jgi:hypothetical protein
VGTRGGRDGILASVGVALAILIAAVGLPVVGSVLAQETPTPVPGPTGTVSPGPTPSPEPDTSAASITDTEYLNVHIDELGNPGPALLKDWLRIRGPAESELTVVDPAFLRDPETTAGSPTPDAGDGELGWQVELPDAEYADLHYEGEVLRDGELYVTAGGNRRLPIEVDIDYYTGPPGAETAVTPEAFEASRGPAKLVFEVTNTTRQMEEVAYTDVQTGRQLTAVVPVWTPYVVKIGPVLFPDEQFDRIQTDGVEARDVEGGGTEVTWTLNLAPPDYGATQTAIAQFLTAAPEIPSIRIVAQPQYPPPKADALTSDEVQFQKGRRSFLFDVFDLLRSNLIALTGVFGLLDDAFANMAIPLISPDKHNREAGSFDDPNQLWALWTLAKGMEQLDRALNVLDNAVQLSRAGVKGQTATVNQLRLLLGKSTDRPNFQPGEVICTSPPACLPDELQEVIDRTIDDSIWANLKDLEVTLGCEGCYTDTLPFLPEAPVPFIFDEPQAYAILGTIRLKLSFLEANLAALQKENHSNQLATFTGISETAESTAANDWRKYTTVIVPVGLEEIGDGLHQLKTRAIDPLQQALGNKDQPNSIIWALHVLTDGMESLSDSFHQLGSTWRYLADSVQNFGLFGVETAQNTLQLDINTIDIDGATRAAAAARVADRATTFMGSPASTEDVPVDTQFVLAFTTEEPERTQTSPLATTGGRIATAVAFGLVILTLLGMARFRWHLI